LAGWDGYTGPDNAQVADPGQAALKTKGLLTGAEAYAGMQFYRSDTLDGYTGRCTVNYGGAGGGVKDAEPMNCNLTGSGELTALTITP
ncbi:phage tail tube protein, partial [Actinophytocola sediminis]